MFLLALGGTLIAINRATGTYKSKRLLEEAAEIGLDYAVKDLNNAITAGTASAFDIPSNSFETVQTLPSSYLSNLLADTTVRIRVRKLNNNNLEAIKEFSTLYKSEYGPGETPDYNNPGVPAALDCLRIAEVTASNGTYSRSIRAILEPQIDQEDDGGGGSSSPPQQQGLFPSAGIFANRNLSLNGTVTAQIHPASTPLSGYTQPERGIDNPDNPATPEYDPSKNYRLDVQTNRFANISGGAKIIGNLKISNSPVNAPATVGVAEDGTQIYGRALTSSGSPDTLQGTAGDTPSAQDEILAQADRDAALGGTSMMNRQGINKYVPVSTSSQSELPQFIPSSVPTDSQAIDPYSSSAVAATYGTTRYVAVNAGQQAFRVNGLDLTSSAASPTALSFLPSGNFAAKVYIEGGAVMDANGDPLPVLNIDSNMFRISDATSNPLQMQIYYGGTQEIRVNVTDGANGFGRFDGIIYAPKAKVSITGKGNFNGSVVADNLNVSSNNPLTLNLVTNLNDVNATSVYGSTGLPPTTGGTTSTSSGSVSPPKGYSPVTYQKSYGKLVN